MARSTKPPASRALIAFACLLISPNPGSAQTSSADQVPELTVTADRIEEPVGETGASVTIIPADRIEKLGTTGVAEALRDVAGLEVVESGGVGSVTSVRLRGSGPGEILVLLDGVRIGNTTDPNNAVDFGNLSAVDIERIEILRGPQSALYGSDAMGGVINIITRKGSKTPRRTVTVEGGSYGTLATRATMSGGDDRWTYALGVNLLHTDGFPRYGYRISTPLTIGGGLPLPPLPADDPTDKGGVHARFTYQLGDGVTVDFGGSLFGNALRFDNPYAYVPSDVFSKYNYSNTLIGDAFLRATVAPAGSALKNQLTVYGNVTRSNIWETEGCYDASFTAFNCRSGYEGWRYGAEYQGDFDAGRYGSLTFGARSETETASTSEAPNPNDGSFNAIEARQTTNSVFAEHRFVLFDRLDLTFGGRVDAIESGETFATWRTTAAYHIDETGTKLRASIGTGDMAATLYQRFSQYGTAGLAPERSLGWDVGVDQKLFADRLTVSASYFDTNYHDLIAFADVTSCGAAQLALGGCYYNVSQAETQGVELETKFGVIPGVLSARAAYTYLDARDLGGVEGDLDAGAQIYRIPRQQAALSLIYDGIPKLEIEPRLALVGARLDENFQTYPYANVSLAAYAKLDLLANYHVNDNLSVFARAENLTNAAYQEVFGYGVAGRSFYGGLSYTW